MRGFIVHLRVARPPPVPILSQCRSVQTRNPRTSVGCPTMSDASGQTARAFSVGRLGVGMLSGAAGHGLAVGAGFLAGAGGERSAASGLEAAGAFLLVAALVFIAVVIAVVGLLA